MNCTLDNWDKTHIIRDNLMDGKQNQSIKNTKNILKPNNAMKSKQ